MLLCLKKNWVQNVYWWYIGKLICYILTLYAMIFLYCLALGFFVCLFLFLWNSLHSQSCHLQRDILSSSLSIWIHFISFPCFITLASSSKMWIETVEEGILVLFTILANFSTLHMMWVFVHILCQVSHIFKWYNL